jgi:hypothetical protein
MTAPALVLTVRTGLAAPPVAITTIPPPVSPVMPPTPKRLRAPRGLAASELQLFGDAARWRDVRSSI